jgi:hypothetical protein
MPLTPLGASFFLPHIAKNALRWESHLLLEYPIGDCGLDKWCFHCIIRNSLKISGCFFALYT